MNRRAIGIVAAATLFAAAAIGAQGTPAKQPAATPQQQAKQQSVPANPDLYKGVVISVDVQGRVIEVIGMHGNPRQFAVPPQVTADLLSKVKAGDTITVKFVESIVVEFQKASAPPMTGPPQKVTVTPAGLPEVTEVKVKVVNCKITAVDSATRTLSFVNGQYTYHFTVAPTVKGFSTIKVGDDLILYATETTAIDITK